MRYFTLIAAIFIMQFYNLYSYDIELIRIPKELGSSPLKIVYYNNSILVKVSNPDNHYGSKLLRYDGNNWEHFTTQKYGFDFTDTLQIEDMIVDQKNNLWLLTKFSLYKFENNKWHKFQVDEQLPDKHFRSFTDIVERNGNIYLISKVLLSKGKISGTYTWNVKWHEIIKFSGSKFTSLLKKEYSDAYPFIGFSTISCDSKEQLWVSASFFPYTADSLFIIDNSAKNKYTSIGIMDCYKERAKEAKIVDDKLYIIFYPKSSNYEDNCEYIGSIKYLDLESLKWSSLDNNDGIPYQDAPKAKYTFLHDFDFINSDQYFVGSRYGLLKYSNNRFETITFDDKNLGLHGYDSVFANSIGDAIINDGNVYCTNTFNGIYKLNNIVSVENRNTSKIKTTLHPNPASSYIRINYEGLPQAEGVIYSLEGLPMIEFSGTEQDIDISSLPIGTYILKLQSGTEVITEKFVVWR